MSELKITVDDQITFQFEIEGGMCHCARSSSVSALVADYARQLAKVMPELVVST